MGNIDNTAHKLRILEGATLLKIDDVEKISEIIKEKVKEMGNI